MYNTLNIFKKVKRKMSTKKPKSQNFVVKNMLKLGIGSSIAHKDKRYEQKQKIRGKKHKIDYKKEY